MRQNGNKFVTSATGTAIGDLAYSNYSENNPLLFPALLALTNIASAVMMDPGIRSSTVTSVLFNKASSSRRNS